MDVTPRGTEILVWRRLQGDMRRRAVGWTLFGTWLGSLFVAVTMAALEPMSGAVDALAPPSVWTRREVDQDVGMSEPA